jgi:hypothetical protein
MNFSTFRRRARPKNTELQHFSQADGDDMFLDSLSARLLATFIKTCPGKY